MYESPSLGMLISMNEPVKQNYSGQQDEKSRMCEGIGSIIYNRHDYMQDYEGRFMSNNMHGYGEYQMQPPKYKYEGQFYVNKKEGYGRFSYPSGAYFEGLYRNDQRFGPGVYTDSAGYQDVGIWVDTKLVRLCRSFEPDQMMPRLANTDEEKIRILRYRQIIHLQNVMNFKSRYRPDDDKIRSLPENLLESLIHLRNYDKSVLARAKELYNRLCRDDRTPSFDKPRYDETFFGNDCDHLTIDVLMTEEEIQQKIEAREREDIEGVVSPRAVIPQITESNSTYEMYPNDDRMNGKTNVSKISQQDKKVEIFNDDNRTEDDESDYCGIKQTYVESTDDKLLMDNHEDQWNVFRNSFITVTQDVPANSSNQENLRESGNPKSGEVGFDDFGRKKIKNPQLTKKVVVTDLMAWNNSPLSIELLKHVFKHRNFEKKLSFDISKMLAGRRGLFRQEGIHEKAALELLEACSNGFQHILSKLISRQNLDVDVADSRGNTGLLLAAASDRVEVIDTLLNLGANVDSINDECLTPLSLCILRLLESIHSVVDWSKAFLPKTIPPRSIVDDDPRMFKNFEQWHGRVSYESLVQQLPKRMDFGADVMDTELYDRGITEKSKLESHSQDNYRKSDLANGAKMQTQKYIFDLSPIIGTSNPWGKSKNNNRKHRNDKINAKPTKDKKSKELNIPPRNKQLVGDSKHRQEVRNSKVSPKNEKINATISQLLRRGADPNFAQVPHPVIIMAIFTKMPSLVSELLEHGADPNTTLSRVDHCLTPLLILAVLQPAYEHALMAEALLKAKADPSIRADPEYRSDLFERLKRNGLSKFIDDCQGVTALHLLAIRPDMDADTNRHLAELIKVIYKYGCIKKSALCQGHSPLSLAISEGNLSAVNAFLETTCVDVNEQLSTDLGNAMLMLQSCALQELLPPDLLQNILELLLEYGGCPFASAKVLKEEYNQIEYGRKQLEKLLNPLETAMKVKELKKINKLKGSRRSKPTDPKNFTRSMEFVEKIAKEKLIKRIQENFVRELLNSPIMLLSIERQSELLKEPIFKNAQTWMTGVDLAIVMKTMNCTRSSIRELVRLFVTPYVMFHRKTLSEVDTLIQNETEDIMNKVMPLIDKKTHNVTAADIELEKDFNEGTKNNNKPILACRPDSDIDDNRFKVCFNCLTVHEKVLIPCPKCKQVYFCSEECNIESTAQETNLHRCPVFYRSEQIRLENIATTLGIDPIVYMLRRFKNPEIYTALENKTGQYQESKGKKSFKDEEFNTLIDTSKCRNQDPTAHNKEPAADQIADEDGNEKEYKNDDTHGTRNKQQIGKTGQSQTEDDDRNEDGYMKSTKPRKNRDDGKSSARNTKLNNIKTYDLLENEVNLSGKMRSKKIDNKRDSPEANGNENAAFDKVKSNNGLKENAGDKKSTKVNKKEDGKSINETGKNNRNETNKLNKTKPKKSKKEDKLYENTENNMKLRKELNERRKLLAETENDKNLQFKSNLNYPRGEKGDEKSNELNDYIRTNESLQRKHKASMVDDVATATNRMKKEMKEINSKISSKRYENNNCYVETNVPEKYLDWLLKVSRSAGEHLDIDMLLMPYVIFAQGDTYFRILPANNHPKYTGNYSLI